MKIIIITTSLLAIIFSWYLIYKDSKLWSKNVRCRACHNLMKVRQVMPHASWNLASLNLSFSDKNKSPNSITISSKVVWGISSLNSFNREATFSKCCLVIMLYPLFVVSNNLSHTPDNLQTDTLNVRCRACRLTGEGALRYGLSCSQKKSQKNVTNIT